MIHLMNSEPAIIVTGGAGLIGSNFVHTWLETCEGRVVNLDKLTYAGNLGNLGPLAENPVISLSRCNGTWTMPNW